MAFLLNETPSITSTLLSAYASISTLSMLCVTIKHELIPRRFSDSIQSCPISFQFFSPPTSNSSWKTDGELPLTQLSTLLHSYPPTVAGSSTTSLLIGNNDANNINAPLKLGIPLYAKIVDVINGKSFEWTLCEKEERKYQYRRERYFTITCKKSDREEVIKSYLPHICRTAENKRHTLEIFTCDTGELYWESTVFKQPATSGTLAIDPELKKFIMQDLDLFVDGKDYSWKVGRAWHLLYGPPGTGKSTLVAAIANHLQFNVYDLQLQDIRNDAQLRHILTSTTNRSILLIEDIDCSSKSPHSRARHKNPEVDDEYNQKSGPLLDPKVTLSGLLNFIDGIWSSCGEERIIIFTTNYKERLDAALLGQDRWTFKSTWATVLLQHLRC